MNAQTQTSPVSQNTACGHTVTLGACQKILNAIEQAREQVKARFTSLRETHEHMLQLALNEAEALAWQTTYPHLLFPALAEEKVQAVNVWAERQQTLRSRNGLARIAA